MISNLDLSDPTFALILPPLLPFVSQKQFGVTGVKPAVSLAVPSMAPTVKGGTAVPSATATKVSQLVSQTVN